MDRIFLILITSFLPNLLLSQDSIKVQSEFSIDLKGRHVISAIANNFDCFNCIFNKVENNPFHHFTIYNGFNFKLIFEDRYTLQTGLYLEERSFSGGSNTLSNLVLYPRIKISANDTISFLGKKYPFKVKGGDFWNEDVGDILRFYNLDYQALQIKGSIGNIWLGFFVIGDLSKNVGLHLHQLSRFSVGYEGNKLENTISLHFNEVVFDESSSQPNPYDFNLSNYFKINLSHRVRLESQIDLRISKQQPISLSFGIRGDYKSDNLTVRSSIRYYNSNYNLGYFGDRPSYSSSGSFTGEQLYPLKNYYRDFAQWAAFTELQNRNLLGYELVVNWTEKVYKPFGVFANLDLNIIGDINNYSGRTYPIYDVGISIEFLKVINGQISLTNKHMNLSNSYQTFYVSKAPFLSYGIYLSVEKIQLKPKFIRI